MAGSTRSITQHPLFPALVTMWFGATFGLCSLVIGKPTLESWVIATGLPEYLAAARPPLGSTARVLLALAACGVGSLLGLALAAMLVRAKSPEHGAETPIAEEADGEAIVTDGLCDAFATDSELEEESEPEIAIVGTDPEPIETPDPDALAPFLRSESPDRPVDSNAPRAPFSVFDELGPDAGIAGVEVREPEHDEIEQADAPTSDHPLVDLRATDDSIEDHQREKEEDVAPDFAGSPPLPSNVHAIDAARLAQHGLPTRFPNDSEPEPKPKPEPVDASTETVPAPTVEDEDLGKLSYLQLTERLAKAIAKNPHPPASLRPRGAVGGASTAVNSPGLERLRRVHARTAPANESATPDADQIRDALSDLRNMGGAA
ncbi:MAG: hypothetical protein COW16_00565 [Sphingomonadales bacterium CG12_big_fil_rev_8_21_14_0_65_65_10]|nr:MAG: hypothetical protein COW16_00565 [Sphingomonadales bacterium CG12_big_fil_rev_8_21_14_0_65_65_10]